MPLSTTSVRLGLLAPSLLLFAQFACSSSDPGAPGAAGSAGSGASAGLSGSAGSVTSGGGGSTAGGAGGAAAAGSSGASLGGSSSGAPAGGSANGGASGGGANGGSAGATSTHPACTPGTATVPVGTQSVTDTKTCLTWTKTRSAMPLTNKAAAKYCADLDQDGINDWRVPRPEELVTWPDLATDSTAYITGPIYIPTDGTVMDGCTGNSHSCNIAKYNDTSLTCAWQGVGFQGWVECVSGTATAGTTKAAYSAATCSPCNGEQASFKETDCSAYYGQ